MEVGSAPAGSLRADAEWALIGKDAERGGQNTECGYRAEHIERLLDAHFILVLLILTTQLILENLLEMLTSVFFSGKHRRTAFFN